MCVCERERECVCVKEREKGSVFVCVNVCVCVCARVFVRESGFVLSVAFDLFFCFFFSHVSDLSLRTRLGRRRFLSVQS